MHALMFRVSRGDGVRNGNLTVKITLCDPASTTNPQALPAGLSEWAILDSNQ